MDNLTHTLIGVAIAKTIEPSTAHASAPRTVPQNPLTRSPAERDYSRSILWTSVIGNNLPDIDFLIPILFYPVEHQKLAYLLHHRGYTHTLLLALPQAFLAAILGLIIALGFKRTWHIMTREVLKLLGFMFVGLIGVLTHIAMDGMNNYGIHPFYPFSSLWHYGDTLFIIEPLVLVSLLVFVLLRSITITGKALSLLSIIAFVTLLTLTKLNTTYLPSGILGVIGGWALLQFLMQMKLRSALFFWTSFSLILGTFSLMGSTSKELAKAAFQKSDSTHTVRQLTATPAPANPLCWDHIALIQSKSNPDQLQWQLLSTRLWPKFLPSIQCPHFRKYGGNLSVIPIQESGLNVQHGPGVYFKGGWPFSLESLRTDRMRSCEFRQFLSYSRTPYWKLSSSTSVAGDIRYDRDRRKGFAELVHPLTKDCPEVLNRLHPTWLTPFMQQFLK